MLPCNHSSKTKKWFVRFQTQNGFCSHQPNSLFNLTKILLPMIVSVRTFKVIETFFRQNILKDFQISRCASVFSTLFWSTEHSLCQNSCQPKILFNLTKTFRFQSSQNSLYLCCCQLRGNCWKKKKTTLIQMALLSVCELDILD